MPLKIFKFKPLCFMKSSESDPQKKVHKNLEKRMQKWQKEYNRAIKILLLGAGESGKTTIIKQMKILHIQGFTERERMDTLIDIRCNIFEAVIQLSQLVKNHNIAVKDTENERSLQHFESLESQRNNFDFTNSFFTRAKNLWLDPKIQEVMSAEFDFPDTAKYFLNRLNEISQSNYIPTDQDILYSRKTTTDIQKIEFQINISKKFGMNVWMYDVGGQKGERRKWIQVFDGIQTILFLADTNTFDQIDPTADIPNANKLRESIRLFKDVWCSRFLQDSGFIVFLNKQDLLKKKVRSGISIGDHFHEYHGYRVNVKKGNILHQDEYTKTRIFIRDMFYLAKQEAPLPTPRKFSLGPALTIPSNIEGLEYATKSNRDCFFHFTTAVDTDNIRHVFEDVQHMIIKTNLALMGLT